MITTSSKITDLQLELLKSFKHLANETEIKEIKSLLNMYFRGKLETSIDVEEKKRNYTAEVYKEWLKSK
jgi:hypothetical protein